MGSLKSQSVPPPPTAGENQEPDLILRCNIPATAASAPHEKFPPVAEAQQQLMISSADENRSRQGENRPEDPEVPAH